MLEILSQPGAMPIPDRLVRALLPVAAPGIERRQVRIRHLDAHSNDVAEVRVPDGRVLMVKRGRYPWSAARLTASRTAAGLLRGAYVRVPQPIPLPDGVDQEPVEAYWRIEHPTLQELWPTLSPARRRHALRSLGRLLRRVHRVEAGRHGPLGGGEAPASLEAHLAADLGWRLLPAVYGEWPQAAWEVERLVALIPRLAERLGDAPPVLLHGDVHLGNVLCDTGYGGARCVGLLDLESAGGGPAEADLAIAQLHHGPLFASPLPDGWFRALLRGYGREPDPFALGFYRAVHLANMGFHSALVGHAEHAESVAAALEWEVDALARAE
ncbi:MAG: aminoglycoside phosphotransferase family protein [Gemmatimonadetes bacterium]|nr:aminoglycoside phosphotransferase family protein [Gemmatimonadota bacterium]